MCLADLCPLQIAYIRAAEGGLMLLKETMEASQRLRFLKEY